MEKIMRTDVIKQEEVSVAPVFTAEQAYKYLQRYAEEEQEMFIVMTLDGGSYPISCHIATIGTARGAMIQAREVFKQAIRDNACSIIIAHNHPSGLKVPILPSKEDFFSTEQLASAGQILEIPVKDHLILGKSGYLSFKEKGFLVDNGEYTSVPAVFITGEENDELDKKIEKMGKKILKMDDKEFSKMEKKLSKVIVKTLKV